MNNQKLHTPDGVRDIYNGECRRKLALQERLHDVLLTFGYQDIQTPTFEFFNIFSQEIGTTPSRDLYKFFDKEGNTLVLRPDFTPSVARSASVRYTKEDMPVKLCYMGNTFINSSDYQGRLKESTQCGAELIGDASATADAEILAMAVSSLQAGGLKEFQISVGHARFFTGLVEAAGLSSQDEDELRELISNKNFLGVEEFIGSLNLKEDLRKLFLLLGSFETDAKDLKSARRHAKNYPTVLSAITELEELHGLLQLFRIDRYISFEPGIISNYHYYTGIIFAGYTFGTGEPILRGGRYDRLLTYFGKNAPSIGFAIVVDQLLSALSRQNIRLDVPKDTVLIVFSGERQKEALTRAVALRAQGTKVLAIPADRSRTRADYVAYGQKNRCMRTEFYLDGEEWDEDGR